MLAREAFARFGKGRSPAGLNTGDCLADSLARATAQPLLFKGEDFPADEVTALSQETKGSRPPSSVAETQLELGTPVITPRLKPARG